MVAIEIDRLTKTFGDTTAVDDLSFTVEDGEVFGLLGPNGAGKSTLINILVTLLRPDAGTATVNGHDIREETAAVRNSLSIVFQEPALDEDLTGEENLAFHARLYGMDKRERETNIDEVFELVWLTDERNDPVGTYSGGMKRRLEIGRGLLHEPTVLFLDEPTVGLDARTRRDTWEYIQRMNEESGMSIVLTTHYIEEAEQLCDRVAIVDDGDRLLYGDIALDIQSLPGHTDGQSGFVLTGDGRRDVFTGDALLPEYTSNVGGADPRVTDPLDRHVQSLTRIAEAGFSKAWPGHRAPITDPSTRARDVIGHYRRRARRILEILDSTDPMTTWEVSDALFGELNHVHIFIGPGEAHAHLDYLDRHGFVEQTTDGYRRTDRPVAALKNVLDSDETS